MKNRHHLIYPAKDYTSGLERKFRNLPCFIVELDFDVHRLLHWMYSPPTKPTASQMREAIDRHQRKDCGCP